MLSEDALRKRLEELESDPRISTYEPANVLTNAPLAIEQITAKTEAQTLRRVLELPPGRYHKWDTTA